MSNNPNSRMSGTQKFILSVLLFLAVLAVGILVMLATGKMVLPL